MTDMLYANMLH